MKTKLLFAIATILIASAVSAQDDENVPQIMFDTLRVGTVEPTRIGVEDMKYIGTVYITHDDSMVMDYITRVVSRDVDFYADFDLIPLDSFYIKTYEIKEMDLPAWKRLGADYVLKLEAEFSGSSIRVYWRIYYTFNNRQVESGRFEMHRNSWRTLAHTISNEVVKTLTGEKGIFLTKIAFIKKIDKAKEICIADYDGANERQLTNNGSINISPTFSPDGKEIYFTSFIETDPKVFKVEIATGKIIKITDFPGLSAAPRISPDGRKIACVLSKDGNSEIYELDLHGRIKNRLTNHPAIETAPSWSPDGELLAFTSDRSGRPQIYIMDKNGDRQLRLTYEGRYNDSPAWSARGDRVIFVSRTESGRFDIASVDTSGYDYHAMTEVGMNENPNFSPDGKHIIFSSTRLGGPDIYTMDVTGRHQRRLTRTGNCTNPVWGPMD